jgi:nucleoside-diphosphate kinase
MSNPNSEVLQFVVEWYDPQPQLKRSFLLKYFVEKHMVEMVDLKLKRVFLKKSACPPEVAASDLYMGAKVLIFSRELDIVDYGDEYTSRKLCNQTQPSMVLLTAKCYNYWGRFIDSISADLLIKSMRTLYVSDPAAEELCDVMNLNQRKRADLVAGACLLISIHGEDGVSRLSQK